jgi:hypothetical protein
MLSLEFTRRSTKIAAMFSTLLMALAIGIDGWGNTSEKLAWLTCALLAAHIFIALCILAIHDRNNA